MDSAYDNGKFGRTRPKSWSPHLASPSSRQTVYEALRVTQSKDLQDERFVSQPSEAKFSSVAEVKRSQRPSSDKTFPASGNALHVLFAAPLAWKHAKDHK